MWTNQGKKATSYCGRSCEVKLSGSILLEQYTAAQTPSFSISLLLALLARALGGPHAWGLNLLQVRICAVYGPVDILQFVQGHIETMDLGAWVPVELVTFVLGRPPSRFLSKSNGWKSGSPRDDLQWWERLSEEVWDAVETLTMWMEAEPVNFTFPFSEWKDLEMYQPNAVTVCQVLCGNCNSLWKGVSMFDLRGETSNYFCRKNVLCCKYVLFKGLLMKIMSWSP